MFFLHRLQQRRLGARAGPVDLVGHEKLAEHRSLDEPEAARAALAFLEHFRPDDVGGHEVRRELDPLFVQSEHAGHGFNKLRLGKAGHANKQCMAPAQRCDECMIDYRVLPEDHFADGGANFGKRFSRSFDFLDTSVVGLIDGLHGRNYNGNRVISEDRTVGIHGLPGHNCAIKRRSEMTSHAKLTELRRGLMGELPTAAQETQGDARETALRKFESAAEKAAVEPVGTGWNPPFLGDIDMRIAVDGTWFYMGSPISRHRLVRLFSSVLRREDDGKYYLVTPAERVGIQVDDAPFVAVAMEVKGDGKQQSVTLRTNMDDEVTVDAAHPMRIAQPGTTGEARPYVLVRGSLEALIGRAVYYELVDLGTVHETSGRGAIRRLERRRVSPNGQRLGSRNLDIP